MAVNRPIQDSSSNRTFDRTRKIWFAIDDNSQHEIHSVIVGRFQLFQSNIAILATIRFESSLFSIERTNEIICLSAWPDTMNSILYLIRITEDMSSAARLYSNSVEIRLNNRRYQENNVDLFALVQEVRSISVEQPIFIESLIVVEDFCHCQWYRTSSRIVQNFADRTFLR